MEKDRNLIRQATIDWLKGQELDLAIEKISYKGLLKQYFDILDEDEDGALDTMEFMKLLERNETITEVSHPLIVVYHRDPFYIPFFFVYVNDV